MLRFYGVAPLKFVSFHTAVFYFNLYVQGMYFYLSLFSRAVIKLSPHIFTWSILFICFARHAKRNLQLSDYVCVPRTTFLISEYALRLIILLFETHCLCTTKWKDDSEWSVSDILRTCVANSLYSVLRPALYAPFVSSFVMCITLITQVSQKGNIHTFNELY